MRATRLGVTRFTERAADALRYVQTWLAEPVDGGWFALAGSRRRLLRARRTAAPRAPRRRSRARAVRRRERRDGRPRCIAARVFDDDGLRAFALTIARARAARRLPARRGRRALRRRAAATCAGLLADHVAMASAHPRRPRRRPGNVAYAMLAEELRTTSTRHDCGTSADGGFFDRARTTPTTVGLLAPAREAVRAQLRRGARARAGWRASSRPRTATRPCWRPLDPGTDIAARSADRSAARDRVHSPRTSASRSPNGSAARGKLCGC